ncbi:hypothetical protein [Streptomyces aurantiogriseus]|uniref:Uncharacterized protein n=1 Tax=Streptomyces aurantiogriseus TaxID=66870 RepID=A0A918C0R7_9ACTN|nr:hypothetical protein [Streptomyces aurantiogriseus]GGQ99392.1 hypothetical protein GCM10010251_13100 [Streptomyces aurantiogriseus]
MSTTDTGPDEPRRLGRGMWRRRGEGRAPGLGRGRAATPQRGNVPPTDTREARRLLKAAEKAGRTAAKDGTLTPYLLGSPHRLPYFGRLIGLRGHARDRVRALHHGHEERQLRASADLYAQTARREAQVRRARARRQEEEQRQNAATSRLDRVATRLAAREDRRDRVLPWMAARIGTRRTDDATPGGRYDDPYAPDAQGTTSDWDDDSGPAAAAAPAAPTPRASWEGLTETAAMARLPRLGLTGLLILVELPVYLGLFLSLENGTREGRTSAFLLAIAVGVAMTVAPFQAGRRWRRRAGTGSLWITVPFAALVVSVWAAAAWYLGDMRARSIVRDDSSSVLTDLAQQYGAKVTSEPQTLLEELGLAPQTVSHTFIALLLLSGGIAFLLAVTEEHPFVAAYRHHGRRLKNAEAALARAEAAAAAARRQQETQEQRRRERDQALLAELAAVDGAFEAAAHAYLDGVQAASHDPAVTEGAMRLSVRYPLLPEVGPTPGSG